MNNQQGLAERTLNYNFKQESVEGENSQPFEYLNSVMKFNGHGLIDLKNAALMNRVDTKYLIARHKLNDLLESLLPFYTALEINGKRIFTYENTYFDTPNMDFYHQHHQGKLNRFKVRHRDYVDSEKGFLEVKFKNNKGRTIKSRMGSAIACIDGDNEEQFLAKQLNDQYPNLQATQWGSYQRIALANESAGERLTLDFNLTFSSIDSVNQVELPNFFIAELKQSKLDFQSPFALEMTRLGIRPKKFSKYCIGTSLLNPALKSNRFKTVLMAAQKFH